MSTHNALVVAVNIEPHNNAEKLGIVRIGGFQCVVNKEQWAGIDKGIYILPDSIVDVSKPEFSFLNKGREKERIKCVRLRGEFSQGLLIPAPEDANIGDNYWEQLGLEWYEPELHYSSTGNFAAAPELWGGLPKYDVDNGRQLAVQRWFKHGESVYVTAKLNGANCSFVYSDGQMHVRSRSGFRAEEDNMFWQALKNTPTVEAFCKAYPNVLVYGEAYGNVKNFKYDCQNGEIKFRVFDIMSVDRTYYDFADLNSFCATWKMPQVPLICTMPFDIAQLIPMAEAPCPLGNKIPEGIVVKPLVDRREGNNRVLMKIVSNQYLEKS